MVVVTTPDVTAPGWVTPSVEQTFIHITEIIFPQWWVRVIEEFLIQEAQRLGLTLPLLLGDDRIRNLDINALVLALAANIEDRAVYAGMSDAMYMDTLAKNETLQDKKTITRLTRDKILRDLGIEL